MLSCLRLPILILKFRMRMPLLHAMTSSLPPDVLITNYSMLNAMLNVIVEEKLYDQQYIQTYVEGFDAWKENVKQFTPEEMAPICGIEADTLREVARAYARAGIRTISLR